MAEILTLQTLLAMITMPLMVALLSELKSTTTASATAVVYRLV